jgi:calcium-dependent protein kinase
MKKYDFPNSEWEYISDEAKDLIKGMICDVNYRLDIDQVIKHNWVRKLASNAKPWEKNTININSLKNYAQSNKLKKATINFIASRLSDKTLDKYKKSFYKIDVKCNGMLDIDEMRKAIGNRGVVEEIFNSIDSERSGVIEYTKFVAANIDKNIYLNEGRLKDAFKIFDLNHNGKISKKEVKERLKMKDNDNEISCLFDKYGIEDEMSFEQFEKMMSEELVNED